MHLTICYLTNRLEPMIEWFWSSLTRECLRGGGGFANLKVVVVDFFHGERALPMPPHGLRVVHTPPKPTVWQGKHRLTQRNYFAASNARNTGLCHAEDGWLAYVDDLSYLMPGWLKTVKQNMAMGNVVIGGAYRKVHGLTVNADGTLRSYRDYTQGWDSRWNMGRDTGPVRMNGAGIFGCSIAAPVEAFLATNGWDEDCDSMGSEDYIWGLMVERNGWPTYYDRRMLTLESEERHYSGEVFARVIKDYPGEIDASHTMLKMVLHGGRKKAPNYFGDEGIAGLRRRVLAGEPFPVPNVPEHHWPDGQPLETM